MYCETPDSAELPSKHGWQLTTAGEAASSRTGLTLTWSMRTSSAENPSEFDGGACTCMPESCTATLKDLNHVTSPLTRSRARPTQVYFWMCVGFWALDHPIWSLYVPDVCVDLQACILTCCNNPPEFCVPIEMSTSIGRRSQLHGMTSPWEEQVDVHPRPLRSLRQGEMALFSLG